MAKLDSLVVRSLGITKGAKTNTVGGKISTHLQEQYTDSEQRQDKHSLRNTGWIN